MDVAVSKRIKLEQNTYANFANDVVGAIELKHKSVSDEQKVSTPEGNINIIILI